MSERGYLTCGNRWCSPCPTGWKQGVRCRDSDKILDESEQYEREVQEALDAYDLAYPEDFLHGMIQAEQQNDITPP